MGIRFNSYQYVGHLALLFKAMEKMTDEEIHNFAKHIDWEAPETVLVRFKDPHYPSRNEAGLRMVYPIQTLIRSASEHVKNTLLRPNIMPDSHECLHVPELSRLSGLNEYRGYVSLAWREALAHLDVAVLEKLFSFEQNKENDKTNKTQANPFHPFWSSDGRDALWTSFGIQASFLKEFPQERAEKSFEVMFQGFLKNESIMFRLKGFKGTLKQKRAQFKREVAGSMMNYFIADENPALIDFCISQKASPNPEMLISAAKTGRWDLFKKTMEYITDVCSLENKTSSTPKNKKTITQKDKDVMNLWEDLEKELAQKARNIYYWKKELNETNELKKKKEALSQIDKTETLIFNVSKGLFEGRLTYPQSSSPNFSRWALAFGECFLEEPSKTKWFGLLREYQISSSAEELSLYASKNQWDVFKQRAHDHLSSITPSKIDDLMKQMAAALQTNGEITDDFKEMCKKVMNVWPLLTKLDSAPLNFEGFTKLLNLDEDQKTFWTLTFNKMQTNCIDPLPRPRM